MTASLFSALVSGAVVGLMLGLLGGGGSILATPLLLYAVGMRDAHAAIGTSAVAVTASAFLNLIGHARAGHVRWTCAALFAVVGSGGALLGSTLGKAFDTHVLLVLFALLMIAVGLLMLRPRRQVETAPATPSWRMCLVTGAVALAAGALSGFFGIGGGFLVVPALIFATGMSTVDAVGSSLLAVGAFGLATSLNYASSGLVDWTIAAEFVAGGVAGGLVGLSLGARLGRHKNLLNRVFAVMIFAAAGLVLYRTSVR